MTARIVVGLGYGDEGKGTIVDFLARGHEVPVTVVRFNGGGQAAHNVVDADGTHHVFSQFGSGTLAGARTHLSRFMLIDPFALHAEAVHLAGIMLPGVEITAALTKIFNLITIDRDCTVVTPFHIAANRLKETMRGDKRHGSCGMGIHEAMVDREDGLVIRAGELELAMPERTVNGVHKRSTYDTMVEIQRKKRSGFSHETLVRLASEDEDLAVQVQMLTDPEAPGLFLESMRTFMLDVHFTDGMEVGIEDELIFEGAQGVLIDEHFGDFPFVTHSTTTPANALTILEEMDYEGEVEVIGVIRGYHTRHGRGPFIEAPDLAKWFVDQHNGYGPWQEDFKVGPLNGSRLKYAVNCIGGVDGIAVTCLDQVRAANAANAYPSERKIVEAIERIGGAPVVIRSYGPKCTDKLSLSSTPASI